MDVNKAREDAKVGYSSCLSYVLSMLLFMSCMYLKLCSYFCSGSLQCRGEEVGH